MIMDRIVALRSALMAVLLVLSPAGVPARADALGEAAGHYVIASSSQIGFVVEQMGGGGVIGSFPEYSGSFELNAENFGQSWVEITLFPGSIIASEPRIEAFLRSDAVFDAARYPEVSFRSTRVRLIDDTTAEIEGNLTAKGKSAKARFRARLIERDRSSIAFHVTGDVHRTRYGMGIGIPIYSDIVHFDMLLRGRRE